VAGCWPRGCLLLVRGMVVHGQSPSIVCRGLSPALSITVPKEDATTAAESPGINWNVTILDASELFSSLVADNFLPWYGIAIFQGEDEIYHRDADRAPIRQSMVKEERGEIDKLSLRVKVWPTPEAVAEHRSPLPVVILGSGLFLALLLSG